MADSSEGKDEKNNARDSADSVEGSEAGATAIPSLSFAADPLAAVAAGEAFAVVPLEWCPHLEFPQALNPLPQDAIDVTKVD